MTPIDFQKVLEALERAYKGKKNKNEKKFLLSAEKRRFYD